MLGSQLVLLLGLSIPIWGLPIEPSNIVDLTHEFANNYTVQWPNAREYNLTVVYRGYNEEGGYYYESNDFEQAEHCGTHTDAPAHFAKDKWRIGDIPLDKLTGPGILIDIEERSAVNPDTELSVDDVKEWEDMHGTIPDSAIVIVKTGSWKRYGNKTAYFGWPPGTEASNPTDTDNLHFPGIHPDAAEWLVYHRNIVGAGVDTASVDHGQSKNFKTHQILGANNVWGLENLNNVDRLPPRGFYIYNMVYKLKEGSGAPSRVIAILDNGSGHLFISRTIVAISVIVHFLSLSFSSAGLNGR